MRARRAAGSAVPLTGASWIMIGMSIASDTFWKKSRIAASGTRIVAPWYGGMTMTIAAPASCARRLRSAQTRELKWVVVTITGTRPATWSRIAAVSVSRSSSASANCSEKFARMQRPFDPASIMKSTQRFWLSRSSAPPSSKVVGTTGKTPLCRGFVDGLMGPPKGLSRGTPGEPLRHAGGTRERSCSARPESGAGRWRTRAGRSRAERWRKPLTACSGLVRRTCANCRGELKEGWEASPPWTTQRPEDRPRSPGALSADTQTDEEAFP